MALKICNRTLYILYIIFAIIIIWIIINIINGKFIEGFADPIDINYFNADKITPFNINSDIKLFDYGDISYDGIINEYIAEKYNNEANKIIKANDKINTNLENIKKLQKKAKMSINSDSIFPVDKSIQTIRSLHNSQILSLIPQDRKYYKVQINDKCLSVTGDNRYDIKDCYDTGSSFASQLFYQIQINNDAETGKYLGNIPSNPLVRKYPFSIFKSAVSDHCLTSSDEGISVEPPKVDDPRQCWLISPDINVC
jgi:hypothetical protein